MSDKPADDPTEAEWKRLALGFGAMFLGTIVFAGLFMWALPFSQLVRLIIVSPPVLVTGWVWIWVVLRHDTRRLRQLNTLAERRGGGRS